MKTILKQPTTYLPLADSLNDTPTLPELSFDDLLDVSPVKKSGGGGGSSGSDDPLELDFERKAREDQTLNTPGPKRPRPNSIVAATVTAATETAMTTATTTTATETTIKQLEKPVQITTKSTTTTTVADGLATAAAKSTSTTTTTTTTTPHLLLNSKNILPKTASFSNQMIKIAPKTMATTSAAAATTTIAGKTAVKTANGQILYIQKAAVGQRLTATTTAGVTATVAGTSASLSSSTAAATSTGNKTVAIQVIRAADGTLVPVKTTTAAAAAAKHQLSGKQIIIKAPLKTSSSTSSTLATTASNVAATSSATTTIAATSTFAKDALKMGMKIQKLSGVTTVAGATAATTTVAGPPIITSGGGKIVVQSASGKQIVVSNQNLIKLSPKTSTSTAATVAGAGGQLQAIQIPGKGLQYVRVVPNSKITVSTSAAAAATSSSSAAAAVARSSATTTATTSTSTLKILNTMPQKFTVVRPSAMTKFMLTQSPKKDASGGASGSGGGPITFSPVTSKVQKTIVTVPTLRPIVDSDSPGITPTASSISSTSSNSSNTPPTTQATLIKNFLSNSGGTATTTTTNAGGFNVVRKHKISEINSEIQRITTNSTTTGGSDPKKIGSGGQQRIVVMSRSMLQPRHGSVQRVTVQGGGVDSGVSKNLSASASSASAAGNATSPRKQFSVLKNTIGGAAATTATNSNPYSSPAQAEIKSLIICGQAKALMAQQQQQHKTYMLKRQSQHQQQQQQQQQQLQQKVLPTAPKAASVAPQQSVVKVEPSAVDIADWVGLNDDGGEAASTVRDIKPSLQSLAEEAGASGAPRRKHCNCSKSQCLKLYCDCFANGEFCQDCTCKDCFNNLQYEDERQRAIKTCLERNPSAFKPKITTARDQGDMRLHNKGCNCKRSGCLKNYCECYEAKIPCSSNCKCVGCRNIEDRPDLDMDPIDPKIMATIANASAASYGNGGVGGAAQKRNYERANSSGQNNRGSHNEKMLKEAAKVLAIHSSSNNNNINNDLLSAGGSSSSSVIGGIGGGGGGVGVGPNLGGGAAAGGVGSQPDKQQQQCNFITQEVIDATIQCMISQADECEKNGLPAYQTEKMIMEEMGRCLVEIIDFSIRNTDTSYTQD